MAEAQRRIFAIVRLKNRNWRCALIAFYLVAQTLALLYFHVNLDRVEVVSDAFLQDFLHFQPSINNLAVLHQSIPETVEDALKYVHSFHSLERKLTFFHIPKTAGTAIENAAGEQHLNWGSCLFKHRPKRPICHYPGEHDWPKNVGYWHIPVEYFPLADTHPYQHAELFGVIRDPYDRMVSEFYYICTLKVTDWRPDQCDRTRLSDKDYMNEWIARKLQRRGPGTAIDYLMDNGHFTPQYEFVVGPHEVRMLDYVLRLDHTLHDQFTALMHAFRLHQVQLRQFNAIGAESRADTATLGVQDLDPSTVRWIHQTYPRDFGEFSYTQRQEL
jgi:uncharacterized membrane protein